MGFSRALSLITVCVAVCLGALVFSSPSAVEGRPGCRINNFGRYYVHPGRPVGFERTQIRVASARAFKGFSPVRGSAVFGRDDEVRSDLRRAPSGPDPLHHHSSPQKPQTP